MHSLSSTLLAMAAATLPTAMGAPRPESATCAGGSGDHGYTYTVTSQKDVPGDSIVGDYSVSGASDGQLTDQSTYTVGVTVEVGLSLGLDYKAIAGEVSGSVSYSTETGTTQGVADTCPQSAWYCALSISPTMVEVSGMAKQNSACGLEGDTVPYTLRMRKMGSDNNPITNAETCTCHNLKDWADPGHLALLCPGDCALPSSS